MITKEEHEVVMKVLGMAEIERLTTEVHKEEAALLAAKAALDSNRISQAGYEGALQISTAAIISHRSAIEKLSASTRSYSQNITALGYATNDFFGVTGGLDQRLNAIANNLSMLLAGFGGIGLALSGIVPIIAMVIRNWDTLASAFGEGGTNKIPEATTLVGRLSDALKDTSKQLDELKKKQALTNDELAKFNELTTEGIRLEKAKADEQEKQAALKKVLESKDADQKERAQDFEKSVAGHGPETLKAIGQAMDSESKYKIDGERKRASDDIQKHFLTNPSVSEQVDFSKKRMGQFEDFKRVEIQSSKGNAEELVRRLTEGKEGAEDRLNQLMENGSGANFGGLGKRMQANGKQARVDKAHDELLEDLDKHHDALREKAVRKAETDTARAYGEDLGDDAMKALTGGADRGDVSEKSKARLRAKLDQDGKIGEGLREEVVNAVVDKMLDRISVRDVSKAQEKVGAEDAKENAADHKAKAQQREKDHGELEKGLGNQFLAQAEAERLDVENNPAFQGRRDKARADYQDRLQRAAGKKLQQSGVDPGRAASLANQAGEFVNEDIQRQLNLQRANGGPAGVQDGMQALQKFLQANGGDQGEPRRRPNPNGGGFKSVPPSAGAGQQPAAGVPNAADPLQTMIQTQAATIAQLTAQLNRVYAIANAGALASQRQQGMIRDQWAAQQSNSYTSMG